MRLFVSVRPSPTVVSHLQTHLRGRRTAPAEQWHVTLAFLGEVADDAELQQGLEVVAASHVPFALQLSGSGTFGQRATVAGVAGDVTSLRSLAADVRGACRDAGIEVDGRAYRPHLTVGRVEPGLLASYRSPAWQVLEIELVQSVLGKRAVHTVRRRYPLAHQA